MSVLNHSCTYADLIKFREAGHKADFVALSVLISSGNGFYHCMLSKLKEVNFFADLFCADAKSH